MSEVRILVRSASLLPPVLSAPTTWGTAGDQVRARWAELGLERAEAMPCGHAWGAIVDWAARQDPPLPILCAPRSARSGPKLACLDPDTRATVLAWARHRLDARGYRFVSLSASDGGGNWNQDPGTGEQATHSPSERLAALASWVQEHLAHSHPGARVVVQAYAATTPPPAQVHPDVVVVVVGPAYMPPGWRVSGAMLAWTCAGARTVQPYVYWSSWYRGDPGAALLMDPDRVVEALQTPRLGEPDALHGAVQWWLTLEPCVAALACALQAELPPSADQVRAWRAQYVADCWPGAAVGRWFERQYTAGPLTWHRLRGMYADCRDALRGASGAEAVRLCQLVQHTRYLELRLTWRGQGRERGTTAHTALVAWTWSVAHAPVLDTRCVTRELGVPQGGPPAGIRLDGTVDDPVTMLALCEARLAALPQRSWEVQSTSPPEHWPRAGGGVRRGVLGTFWRPDKPAPGRWYTQADDEGLIALTVRAGCRGPAPAVAVELAWVHPQDQVGRLGIGDRAVRRWLVPADGSDLALRWTGLPGRTYELRCRDGAHRQGIVLSAAPGLPLAFEPDPAARTPTLAGQVRAWMRVRPGAAVLGVYATGDLRVWAPGVQPDPRWSKGWHYQSSEPGEHTISIEPHWGGQWLAVAAHWIVPLHGAEPFLVRRPDEGPYLSSKPYLLSL